MKALNNIAEKNIIFFDIETARAEKVLMLDTPTFNAWAYSKRKKEPNMTDIDIITSYQSAASLFPEYSRVVSVVLGVIRNNQILTMTYDDLDEKKLLTGVVNHFTKLVEDNPRVVLSGWNIKNFDMPFLFKRMVINGISPHALVDTGGDKPWEITAIDLMELWKTGFSPTSLLSAATAFGLPSPKDDIDGSQVSEVFWSEGVSRISEYCVRDVVTTVNVYRKMCLKTPLKPAKVLKEIVTEKLPLLSHLFEGGKYGAKEKKELQSKFSKLSDSEKPKARVILNAMVSTAKGKKTSLTKKDVKELC